MPPRTRSADPATTARVREVVKEVLERHFDDNQVRMAARLGISQSTISDILSGRKGPGPVLFDAIARYDIDLARRAWGVDAAGATTGLEEVAAELAKGGVDLHVARVVARTAIELGHEGSGAVATARALAVVVSALARPRSGTSQNPPDSAADAPTPAHPRRARAR